MTIGVMLVEQGFEMAGDDELGDRFLVGRIDGVLEVLIFFERTFVALAEMEDMIRIRQ